MDLPSLESTSIQALLQISESSFPRDPTLPRQRSAPRRLPLKPFRVCTSSRPMLSRQRDCKRQSPPLLGCRMDAFRSFLTSGSQVFRCKCLFLGGGGFKVTSKSDPCTSPLCINRVQSKFQWQPEQSQFSQSTRVPKDRSQPSLRTKVSPMLPLKPQGCRSTQGFYRPKVLGDGAYLRAFRRQQEEGKG